MTDSWAPPGGAATAQFRTLAASLSAAEAAQLIKRCAACLADELRAGNQDRTSAPITRLAAVIRGGGAEAPMVFLIEYWQPGGEVGGDVREVAEAEAQSQAQARVEVASCDVLLDLAAGRLSPLVAMARRKVKVSGEMQAARPLAPFLKRAVPKALGEFQEGRSVVSRTSQASSAFGFWMPDHASPTCVLCGRAWMPIIRQRHHCRACGSLVCGQCSFCPNGRSSRRCLRCGVDASLQWNGSTASMSSMSMSASVIMTPRMQESFTTTAAAPIEEKRRLPSLPPNSETEGLLLAQLQAALAPKIRAPIPASQPSEREQRLWERVVAAEKRTLEAEAEGGFRKLGQLLLGSLLAFVARHAFLVAVFFLGVTSHAGLKQFALSLGGERLSAYGEHLFIFVVATAAVLLLSIFRPVSLLVSAVTLSGVVWLLVRTFSLDVPGSASLSGDWRALAFPVAVLHLPGWSTTCFLLGISVLVVRRLQSYHYFLRLAEIYVTAAFPIAFYFTCKTVQKVFKLSAQQAQDWMYDPADKIVAPFLGNRFAALGGLFVKAGQWMANMAATPIVWQQELKKLQDCAPRDTDTYVKSLLEAELGSDFQDIFEEFEFEPVASASIAQVHKARMKGTGQQVAVKLQHEGVEPMMLLDLTALKRILRFTCWLGGNDWDEIKQVTEGWMKEMIHELDFHREVENLQEVRKGMADAGVDVIVPSEIEGRVSRRAFIMDFCEGFRFTDLDQLALAGVDRKALSARAVHAVATQLLEIGVFNSDPHGGNLLCQVRDGTTAVPVLLDFGNCIRLPEEQRLLYCRLLVALSETSMTSVCEAMKNLGFFNSQTEVHPGRDMEYMMMVFRDTGNRKHQMAGMKNFRELRKSQNKSDIEALDENIKKDKKKAKAKTERYPKKMPPEAVLFLRMMLLVRGLCFQLDAELPFLQLFEMHARRALACRFPKVHRALSAVSTGDDRGRSRAGAAHMAMVTLIREAIAACCVERPGLGVQVCVYIGENCAVDECGGVLGTVDPRPMTRSTRIPLADLARLPWLLALHSAVKQGMIQYSERLMSMPVGSRCNTEATLADVLSHRAFQGGDPRDALTGSTVTELAKLQHMQKRMAAAIAPGAGQACYLPWGSGYVAAAALRQLGHDDEVAALERLLPGFKVAKDELALRASTTEDMATLSSALFADLRGMAGGAIGSSGGIFTGPAAQPKASGPGKEKEEPAAAKTAGKGKADKETDDSPKKQPDTHRKTLARSVFEDAGGLLADVGLANQAALWTSEVCPDLACASSARSLAWVLASACPTKDARPVCAREVEISHSHPMGMLLSQLAPAPRSWDDRGLQVMELEGCGKSALGLSSCGGLLGLALQWPGQALNGSGAAAAKPVTAVVLCNELSMAAVPSQILGRVADALRLPRPSGLM